jgi:hypothetical protein
MPDTVDRQIEAARARFEGLDRRLARAQRSRPNAATTKQLRRQRDQAGPIFWRRRRPTRWARLEDGTTRADSPVGGTGEAPGHRNTAVAESTNAVT